MATKTSAKKTGGILGGIALFVVGIFILWNNEGRTVKEQNAINEALKGYTDVSSEKIDSKYEGKIIATTGKIDLSNTGGVFYVRDAAKINVKFLHGSIRFNHSKR